MKLSISIIFGIIASLVITSCNSRKSNSETIITGDTLTTTAKLLKITDCGDFTIADITNPWDTTKLLQRYILIDRNSNIDQSSLPKGILVKTPLQSSIVYSSVHANAIDELGAIKRISGICDAQYYKIDKIIQRLSSGDVIDIGSSMSPSIERIIELNPDAILTSPFQNAGHGAIEQLNIPIIECADYMEATPLGRAEWIKLLGKLYGNRHVADSIFKEVSNNYNQLKDSIASLDVKSPTVISECVTDGVWYMPGGKSYMAQLFYDAGADYAWKDDNSTGSLQLDFATVYDKAHNADIWLIKTFGRDLTLNELQSSYPLHNRMDAFKNGGVYSCNTATTSLFEDFPFHPDMLLIEFINIFHNKPTDNSTLNYYKQVK